MGKEKIIFIKGGTIFRGIHQNDILALSSKQQAVFKKENIADLFPEFYIIKVNKFNDIAKDSLDEWVYFLKNSEVRDEFKAKGLKEAGEILDIMRLPDSEQYSYNRYLDYLHFKASEIISLKSEAEERSIKLAEENTKIKIAENSIHLGLDNLLISEITKLTNAQVEEIRNKLKK